MNFSVPYNYDIEFRESIYNNSTLLVVCSHKGTYAFYKTDWERPTLFIRDISWSYYLLYAGSLCDSLKKFIVEKNFKKILFLGLSKGGTGACILSSLCAKYMPDRKFYSIAFSPQLDLYPENGNFVMPTYKKMIERSNTNKNLLNCLLKYGKIDRYIHQENLFSTLVYNENYKMDAIEAGKISGWNIRKIPLPFNFHGAVLLFSINLLDTNELHKTVEHLYDEAKKDSDLAATVPFSKDDLIKQLKKMNWLPRLKTFVNDTFMINF